APTCMDAARVITTPPGEPAWPDARNRCRHPARDTRRLRRLDVSMRYSVVIPVLNQLHYTKQCVDSLIANGVPAESVLVIDNGSTDDTPAWLAQRSDIRSVRNPVNLGCGGAWT